MSKPLCFGLKFQSKIFKGDFSKKLENDFWGSSIMTEKGDFDEYVMRGIRFCVKITVFYGMVIAGHKYINKNYYYKI